MVNMSWSIIFIPLFDPLTLIRQQKSSALSRKVWQRTHELSVVLTSLVSPSSDGNVSVFVRKKSSYLICICPICARGLRISTLRQNTTGVNKTRCRQHQQVQRAQRDQLQVFFFKDIRPDSSVTKLLVHKYQDKHASSLASGRYS